MLAAVPLVLALAPVAPGAALGAPHAAPLHAVARAMATVVVVRAERIVSDGEGAAANPAASVRLVHRRADGPRLIEFP